MNSTTIGTTAVAAATRVKPAAQPALGRFTSFNSPTEFAASLPQIMIRQIRQAFDHRNDGNLTPPSTNDREQRPNYTIRRTNQSAATPRIVSSNSDPYSYLEEMALPANQSPPRPMVPQIYGNGVAIRGLLQVLDAHPLGLTPAELSPLPFILTRHQQQHQQQQQQQQRSVNVVTNQNTAQEEKLRREGKNTEKEFFIPEVPENIPEAANGGGEKDPTACRICLTNLKEAMAFPCGHKVFCLGCPKQYPDMDAKKRICPVCKQQMTRIVRVFE